MILKAIQFAAEAHRDQIRRSTGLPYILHPISVMELVQKWIPDSKHLEELKIAALLHDTLEDCDVTYHQIEREFTPLVASIVLELTSNQDQVREIGKNLYLIKKMISMRPYSFTLKLLDRMSNILDNPSEKYIKNTIEMMKELKIYRCEITERQEKIMDEITSICKSKEK